MGGENDNSYRQIYIKKQKDLIEQKVALIKQVKGGGINGTNVISAPPTKRLIDQNWNIKTGYYIAIFYTKV